MAQYDNHEFEEALKTFDTICDTSKILFNCGMIHATLGQHEQAVSGRQMARTRVLSDSFTGRMLSTSHKT